MATDKRMSHKDAEQATRYSYNDANATMGVDGFLVGKVGRKVVQTIATTTNPDDTLVFDFSENGVALYQLTLIFTDASQEILISAERTA